MTPGQTKARAIAPARRSLAWWQKLFLLVVSLIIGLVLSEVALRLLGADQPLFIEPDPVVGWRHIPGAQRQWTEEGNGWVQINRLGHRDVERQLDKPAGAFRIAVVGDSMTEAAQVNLDQTFTQLLEKRLASKDHSVEVLNFGIQGFGPLQELLQLRREVMGYKPDLVIVALFLDNDIADCHPDLRSSATGIPFARVKDGQLEIDYSRAEESYASYHKEPIHSLRKYSGLYRIASRWRKDLVGAQAAAGPSDSVPRRFQLYLKSPPPAWDEACTTLEVILSEMAAETRKQGIPLVVLSLPCGQAVNPKAWQNILDTSPILAQTDWDLEAPQRRMSAIADRQNLLLLQPYSAFKEVPQDPPLFFGNAGHMTPRGHELMAPIIEGFLRERRLLPANLLSKEPPTPAAPR